LRFVGLQRQRLAIGCDGIDDTAGLEKDLALELPEIGIVAVLLKQQVDLRLRFVDVTILVKGDGAGITRIVALVRLRIAAEGHVGIVDEAVQLGLDHLQLVNALRRILLVVEGRSLDALLQSRETVLGNRMAADEGILLRARQGFLVAELREEVEHALARKAGFLKVACARLIGAGFLLTAVSKDRPLGDRGAACDDRHARVARAGGHGADAEDHRGNHRHAHFAHGLLTADQMAAGHMARLVCNNAAQLKGRIDLRDKAGIEEEPLADGHECVNARILHEVDADRRGRETGRAPDRRRIFAHHVFRLGVPDERNTVGPGGCYSREGEQRRQAGRAGRFSRVSDQHPWNFHQLSRLEDKPKFIPGRCACPAMSFGCPSF